MYPIIIRQSHKATPCIHCKNPTHSIDQHDRHICNVCIQGNSSSDAQNGDTSKTSADGQNGDTSKTSGYYADVTDKFNYLDELCEQNSLILEISIYSWLQTDLIIKQNKPTQLTSPDKNNKPIKLTSPDKNNKPIKLTSPDKNNNPIKLTLPGTTLFLDKAQLDEIVSKLVGIANIVSNGKGE